jgi:hypothetical protein
MDASDLTISDFLHVVAVHDGNIVQLTFKLSGRPNIGPIRLSRAEAIAAGGDIARDGTTKGIPINFSAADATAFGPWLMRFAAE